MQLIIPPTYIQNILRHAAKTKLPHSGLSLDDISNVCCEVWAIDKSILIGKINHKNELNKLQKLSFLCAAYFYSNEGLGVIAAYMGCHRKIVMKAVDLIPCIIGAEDYKYHNHCMEIFNRLFSKEPKRVVELYYAVRCKELEESTKKLVDQIDRFWETSSGMFKPFKLKSVLFSNEEDTEVYREDLIGKPSRDIEIYYQDKGLPILRQDMQFWIGLEEYEICGVIKSLIEKQEGGL